MSASPLKLRIIEFSRPWINSDTSLSAEMSTTANGRVVVVVGSAPIDLLNAYVIEISRLTVWM